jgi:hypothetical protein
MIEHGDLGVLLVAEFSININLHRFVRLHPSMVRRNPVHPQLDFVKKSLPWRPDSAHKPRAGLLAGASQLLAQCRKQFAACRKFQAFPKELTNRPSRHAPSDPRRDGTGYDKKWVVIAKKQAVKSFPIAESMLVSLPTQRRDFIWNN